jgi:hypothetical protein
MEKRVHQVPREQHLEGADHVKRLHREVYDLVERQDVEKSHWKSWYTIDDSLSAQSRELELFQPRKRLSSPKDCQTQRYHQLYQLCSKNHREWFILKPEEWTGNPPPQPPSRKQARISRQKPHPAKYWKPGTLAFSLSRRPFAESASIYWWIEADDERQGEDRREECVSQVIFQETLFFDGAPMGRSESYKVVVLKDRKYVLG